MVLTMLEKHQLYAKMSKRKFLKHTLKFLGHIVSDQRIQVHMPKVKVLVVLRRTWGMSTGGLPRA
jgi:hypothetical protein